MTFTTEIFNTKDKLPEDGAFVACRYTGGNWGDEKQYPGVYWKTGRFRKIKPEYRQTNDVVDYEFYLGSGGHILSGHEVDLWFNLPTSQIKEKS